MSQCKKCADCDQLTRFTDAMHAAAKVVAGREFKVWAPHETEYVFWAPSLEIIRKLSGEMWSKGLELKTLTYDGPTHGLQDLQMIREYGILHLKQEKKGT